MAKPAELEKLTGVASRFGAFVAERYPFALDRGRRRLRGVDRRARAEGRGRIRCAAAGVSPRARATPAAARGPSGASATPRRGRAPRTRIEQAFDAAARRLRRVPAPRRDRGVAHARRARRDPARHDAHARDRQPPEGVLHGGEVRYGRTRRFREGLPIARGRKRSTRAAIRLRPRRRAIAAPTAGGRATSSAPMIRDLGATLAMRPRARDRPDGAQRADGEGRPADGRQGPPRRRFRLGHPAAGRAAGDRDADDRRHGDGLRARRLGRASRCRSSAKAGRRSASGTRRSTSAPRGGCRRSSACRTTRRRCRRRSPISPRCACSPTRPPATAFPASRIDGTDPDAIAAAFALGGRAGARGAGPTLIELVVDAHVRPRASRRHAVSRPRSAAVVGVPAARPTRATPTASSTRTGPRAIRFARYAARLRGRGHHRAGRSRALQARGRSDRRGAGARGHRRAVARAGAGGRRRVRERSAARARRGARSGRSGSTRRRGTANPAHAAAVCVRPSSRRRRSIRRAGRSSRRSCSASATRCAPIRACSCTARTSAAATATRSCCCGRCSKEFGDRILNSPLAEGAVLGVCVGAALAGQRPIGEMQFNDFVATGFNQLVNNAAKIRYRWGGERADGRAHAVGRAAPRRPVPLPEHRGLVLPHAGSEDRRARRRRTTRAR